jgi:GNAT superfamily N-acetyltransferase
MTIDPSRIKVRPAIPEDVDFVAHISEVCMRGYVEQIWGQWDFDLPRTRFVPGRYQIVSRDNEDIGCVDVWDEADQFQLNILYLMPSAQNQGIGTLLMRDVLSRADAAGKPVRLRVLRPNPARQFYERFGFVITEEVPERFFMERPCQRR